MNDNAVYVWIAPGGKAMMMRMSDLELFASIREIFNGCHVCAWRSLSRHRTIDEIIKYVDEGGVVG